uniref:Uncharacterized protein n=1 Tax=Schistosoma haematobium TaxID=6185 RepID=A0A095A6D5_SCHHA
MYSFLSQIDARNKICQAINFPECEPFRKLHRTLKRRLVLEVGTQQADKTHYHILFISITGKFIGLYTLVTGPRNTTNRADHNQYCKTCPNSPSSALFVIARQRRFNM